MTDCITRNEATEHLPKMPHPIPGHEPKWTSVDCPNCGTVPCWHPDVLICTDDEEDYPCHVVQMVANELERQAVAAEERGEAAHESAQASRLPEHRHNFFGERAAEFATAERFRARAAELRGDQS